MTDATETETEAAGPPAAGSPRYAPLSWDAAVAVRAGLLAGPYPEDFNGVGFTPPTPTPARSTKKAARIPMISPTYDFFGAAGYGGGYAPGGG